MSFILRSVTHEVDPLHETRKLRTRYHFGITSLPGSKPQRILEPVGEAEASLLESNSPRNANWELIVDDEQGALLPSRPLVGPGCRRMGGGTPAPAFGF